MSLSDNKKVYNIILQKQVKNEIDDIARKEERSSSNLINLILKKFVCDYQTTEEGKKLNGLKEKDLRNSRKAESTDGSGVL